MPRFWHGLCRACEHSASGSGAGGSGDAAGGDMELDLLMSAGPLAPTTLAVAGKSRVRLTLLPPPTDRRDPLAVADVARCAELVVLLLPGGEPASATAAAAAAACGGGGGVDASGETALAVLRALGLPSLVCCVVGAGGSGAAAASMKDRSAAKKRAEKALAAHLAGEHKLHHADTTADLAALARHLAEHGPSAAPPLWRQQRPMLMAERAEYEPAAAGGGDGTLVLYGYVRGAGLSANQLVTVPGAGDYRIVGIHGPKDPHAGSRRLPAHQAERAMDVEEGGEAAEGQGPLLAQPDVEEADQLVGGLCGAGGCWGVQGGDR